MQERDEWRDRHNVRANDDDVAFLINYTVIC